MPEFAPNENDVSVEFYKNDVDGQDHIRFFLDDKNFIPDFLACDFYKGRYPDKWEKYKNNEDQLAGQTRLSEAVWIDEATRNTLYGQAIKTLEQLAKISDAQLTFIGAGARSLRDKAQELVKDKMDLARFREMQSTEQSKGRKAARA